MDTFTHISCLPILQVAGMAVPEDVEMQTSPSSSLLRRHSDSGLSFDAWVSQMVQDGHLHPPRALSPNSTLSIDARDGGNGGWTARLFNVGCTKEHGNQNILERAEDSFCGWVAAAEDIAVKNKEQEMNHNLCSNGLICSLFLKTTLNFFFPPNPKNNIGQMCHDVFNRLRDACPDGGGVADAEVTLASGETAKGRVEASFSPDDGKKCVPRLWHRCKTMNEL